MAFVSGQPFAWRETRKQAELILPQAAVKLAAGDFLLVQDSASLAEMVVRYALMPAG